MRDLFLLGLAACGPQWLDAHEQPIALRDAVAAAASDYHCDRVVPRCDASHDTTWEFELDVCGHVRRYTVNDETYGEVRAACSGAVCPTLEPACRSVMRGSWWAVETKPPERCDDAPVDDGLHADFDERFVTVTADGRRVVNASCSDPSFLVNVDDRWFSLCGSRAATVSDGIAIEPGLLVGGGSHDIYAVYVGLDGCVRSRETARTIKIPLVWKDL